MLVTPTVKAKRMLKPLVLSKVGKKCKMRQSQHPWPAYPRIPKNLSQQEKWKLRRNKPQIPLTWKILKGCTSFTAKSSEEQRRSIK